MTYEEYKRNLASAREARECGALLTLAELQAEERAEAVEAFNRKLDRCILAGSAIVGLVTLAVVW